MIVEEKKAGEHICPHLTEWRQKCEGSRCMAWRWVDKGERYYDPVIQRWASKPDLSTTHGYCGLGGRP